MSQPYICHRKDILPVSCPCGESRRLITREHSPNVGLHITHITQGKRHYHKKTTEIYYVLTGSGTIECEGQCYALSPGMAVYIPPGVAHRGWGDFEAIIVTCPAFDPEDEFIVI